MSLVTPGPLAVIGCGAISESYYFPALAQDPALRDRVWLVDPSEERRSAAARRFGFPLDHQSADIAGLPESTKATINATPSHLHVATTLPLLERGVSVLVEKPLAEFADEARKLVEAADRNKCLLSVNQFRRLRPINVYVRDFIKAGSLGALRGITWREGHKFDWPTQSGFYFRRPWRDGRPRGALLDIGVHVLDLVCWWLDETPTVSKAIMDGHGGPEGYVDAALAVGAIDIRLQISFHAKLANSFELVFERGTLRGSTTDSDQVEIEADGKRRAVTVGGAGDWTAIAATLVGNFVDAVEGRGALLIDARSVVAPLTVIDRIYDVAVDELPECYKEWVA